MCWRNPFSLSRCMFSTAIVCGFRFQVLQHLNSEMPAAFQGVPGPSFSDQCHIADSYYFSGFPLPRRSSSQMPSLFTVLVDIMDSAIMDSDPESLTNLFAHLNLDLHHLCSVSVFIFISCYICINHMMKIYDECLNLQKIKIKGTLPLIHFRFLPIILNIIPIILASSEALLKFFFMPYLPQSPDLALCKFWLYWDHKSQ